MDQSSNIKLFTPILIPLAGIITGILIARCNVTNFIAYTAILLGIGLYAAFLKFSKSAKSASFAYKFQPFHNIWIYLISLGLGIISTNYNSPNPLSETQRNNTKYAVGKICDKKFTTLGDNAIISVSSLIDNNGIIENIPELKILLIKSDINADIDDIVLFPGDFVPIADSPNIFETGFAERLRLNGILYKVSLIDKDLQMLYSDFSIAGWFKRLRHKIEGKIENSGLSQPTQHFIITILLGDRSYLDYDTRQQFSDAGISHIIALSGMHISIIGGIILFILFPLNFFGLYKWRYLITIPVLWFYIFITGASPSTMRAGIMMTCIITCLLLERKNQAWNALLLSAFIILLIDPFSLYDIGFQLSCLCVGSLILFLPSLIKINQHDYPKLFTVLSFLASTIIATLGSWIISAYYFNTFPSMFIPANIIALPLMPIYMIATLIYLFLDFWGIRFTFLKFILDNAYQYMLDFLNWINPDSISTLHIQVPAIALVLWLLALTFIALRLYSVKKKYITALSALCAISAICAIPIFMYFSDNNDSIIFQDYADRPSIAINLKNNVSEYKFPVNQVSLLKVKDLQIVTADCNISNTSLKDSCDLLIITRSCTTDISKIQQQLKPRKIIIHPSVYKKREQELIRHADSLLIPVHSLRLHAPLRIRVE